MANPYSDRAVLIVDAHCDDRPFEPGVGHAGHGEKKLTGEKRGTLHPVMMGRRTVSGKAE